jgi:hypothetical protein
MEFEESSDIELEEDLDNENELENDLANENDHENTNENVDENTSQNITEVDGSDLNITRDNSNDSIIPKRKPKSYVYHHFTLITNENKYKCNHCR